MDEIGRFAKGSLAWMDLVKFTKLLAQTDLERFTNGSLAWTDLKGVQNSTIEFLKVYKGIVGVDEFRKVYKGSLTDLERCTKGHRVERI